MVSHGRWKRTAERPMPLFASPPASRKSLTSQAAAKSVAHAVSFIEDRIVEHVRACGANGATAEETATALELRTQTCSARFSEMRESGRLIDSGRTRRTSSGRAAVVWIHPAHGGSHGCSRTA